MNPKIYSLLKDPLNSVKVTIKINWHKDQHGYLKVKYLGWDQSLMEHTTSDLKFFRNQTDRSSRWILENKFLYVCNESNKKVDILKYTYFSLSSLLKSTQRELSFIRDQLPWDTGNSQLQVLLASKLTCTGKQRKAESTYQGHSTRAQLRLGLSHRTAENLAYPKLHPHMGGCVVIENMATITARLRFNLLRIPNDHSRGKTSECTRINFKLTLHTQ